MSTHDVFAAAVASSATDGYPRRSAWRAAVQLGGVAWAALTLLGVSLPASALARTSCVYAGAPVNTLTVRVNDDSVAEITRVGMGITVRPQDGPLTRCAGGTATVLNTDTIKVMLVDLDFVDLDLPGFDSSAWV